MALRNSVHYRALEHARDAIRGVTRQDGGFRDLRHVTNIAGDAVSTRGTSDVQVLLELTNIGLGAENPNLVSESSMDFEVSIWFVVSEEHPSEIVSPQRALNYLFRDIWKALMEDPHRGGLAMDTSFVNARFGERGDDEAGFLAILDWQCGFEHDGEDIAVIHTEPLLDEEGV